MTIESGNKATNAGSYEVVVTLDDNHVWDDGSDGKVTWNIEKATYDMSGVNFSDLEVTYDGNEHILEIDGQLPEGVSVSYTTNKLINVGTIEVVASFTGNSNYHTIPNKTASLTVKQAQAVIDVDANDIEVVYGDKLVIPVASTNFGEVVIEKVDMAGEEIQLTSNGNH